MASSATTAASTASTPPSDHVPFTLRVVASWSWRLIVVGIVVYALTVAFSSLATVLLPMVIALLVAAPLETVVTRMNSWGIPRGLGAILAILTLVGVVVGLTTLAGAQIVSGFIELQERAMAGLDRLIDWLSTGPFDLSREQLDSAIDRGTDLAQENALGLASGAFNVTGIVGAAVAGILIAIIALFFFLRDGRVMWLWIAGLFPGDETTARVDRATSRAWVSLRRYTDTMILVAFVNATGIGFAAWILGVPMVIPIAILTFLLAFIPLLGATLSGVIATLIALVDSGWTTALLMLAAVVVVQQLEGNVLYPWLFGKAAAIHPFAILVTISAGTLTAGIVGAILAVPVLAFAYTWFIRMRAEFSGSPIEDEPDEPITSQIPIAARKSSDAVKRAISKTGEIAIRRRRRKSNDDDGDGDGTKPKGSSK